MSGLNADGSWPPGYVIGSYEVAQLLNTWPPTVSWWRRKGMIPDADAQLKCGPVWRRSVIVEWAKKTGRWPHE